MASKEAEDIALLKYKNLIIQTLHNEFPEVEGEISAWVDIEPQLLDCMKWTNLRDKAAQVVNEYFELFREHKDKAAWLNGRIDRIENEYFEELTNIEMAEQGNLGV